MEDAPLDEVKVFCELLLSKLIAQIENRNDPVLLFLGEGTMVIDDTTQEKIWGTIPCGPLTSVTIDPQRFACGLNIDERDLKSLIEPQKTDGLQNETVLKMHRSAESMSSHILDICKDMRDTLEKSVVSLSILHRPRFDVQSRISHDNVTHLNTLFSCYVSTLYRRIEITPKPIFSHATNRNVTLNENW